MGKILPFKVFITRRKRFLPYIKEERISAYKDYVAKLNYLYAGKVNRGCLQILANYEQHLIEEEDLDNSYINIDLDDMELETTPNKPEEGMVLTFSPKGRKKVVNFSDAPIGSKLVLTFDKDIYPEDKEAIIPELPYNFEENMVISKVSNHRVFFGRRIYSADDSFILSDFFLDNMTFFDAEESDFEPFMSRSVKFTTPTGEEYEVVQY